MAKLIEQNSSVDSSSRLQELLTGKETRNDDTPLHILAQQSLEVAGFRRLFESLGIKISCMEQTNSFDDNPLHVAASRDKRNFVELTWLSFDFGSARRHSSKIFVIHQRQSRSASLPALCWYRALSIPTVPACQAGVAERTVSRAST